MRALRSLSLTEKTIAAAAALIPCACFATILLCIAKHTGAF